MRLIKEYKAMKHLVLLTLLLATPAAAQTSMLADPTLPEDTDTIRIVPEAEPISVAKTATEDPIPSGIAKAIPVARPYYVPDSTAMHFPRPVYKPECGLEGPQQADGSIKCLREVTFANDAPLSLVLGQM